MGLFLQVVKANPITKGERLIILYVSPRASCTYWPLYIYIIIRFYIRRYIYYIFVHMFENSVHCSE